MTESGRRSFLKKALVGLGVVAVGLGFGVHVPSVVAKSSQTPQVSTASLSGDLGPNGTRQRAFNTVYHNTTGKTMLVSVSVSLVSLTGQGLAEIDVLVGSSNPPTPVQMALQINFPTSVGGFVDIRQGVAFIPAGYYYLLSNIADPAHSNYIQHWYEMLL